MAGGIYEQSEWPDSRWDCVTVCDGCHPVVWGTFWDDYASAARDAYFARNGWRNYCVPGDTEILELCPACAVRALRRGETRGLADTWLRPTHAYTHAFREVDAQLSARERVVANLLLTELGPQDEAAKKLLAGSDPSELRQTMIAARSASAALMDSFSFVRRA